MDPTEIGTLPQLADALDQLRRERSLSLQALADAAKKLPTRGGRRPALPRSTASDLLNAKSMPEAETVVTFLAACGIHEEEVLLPWLHALERVATQHQRRPPGTVRVRDTQPRVLGVHTAIQTTQQPADAQPGPGEGELPLYVPRDFDADLRTKLTRAQHQGGFVLLTGDSSVGKTRALFEAVKAVMPDWWLLHPRDAEALREFAAHPTGRTVVWLDELQDYLDFAGGVPAGQVRDLIAAGVVLVATCWPGEHSKRIALPKEGQPDPYANDRRLLDLADVLHVSAAFSSRERRRAEDLAGTDRRIRVALDTPDAGFTQVMAAGPELIRHWHQAPAYAHAIITAALDARRVGAHAPLTRDYLAHAAPGYLNEREVATAPADWLDGALDYATRLLHGATAALTPVAAGMGTIAGYRVADYLHQHALRVRRYEPLPDTAWHALFRHHHPDDTGRLADNADRRGRDHEATTLYLRLADGGDGQATRRLAELLVEQGQLEQLRARADNGDKYAAVLSADLLVQQGHMEDAIRVLHPHAVSGEYAAVRFAELLAKQGHVDQLRARADNGDKYAARELAELLAEQGEVDQLRARANNGDRSAAVWLADLLVEQGLVEDAIRVLRPHADHDDGAAIYRVADLLTAQGQLEDALHVLRPRADNGDGPAARRVADLLVRQDRVGQLRACADNGNEYATRRLIELLAEQGQLEQLRAHADNGNEYATRRLADLLVEQGRIDDALEVLSALAENGDPFAAHRMAELRAERGEVEQLQARADNGDEYPTGWLPELLADQGRVEELEREVLAGTSGAAAALRRLRPRLSTHSDRT